jgi:hypothetical protein
VAAIFQHHAGQILAALVIGPAFQLAQLPFTILKF